MPSPFPGMDPFLEHPSLFPGLHNRLIAALSDALQARLPEPYFAEIGERVWVEVSGRSIEPDVNLLRGPGPGAARPAVDVGPARPVVVTVPVDDRRETWVEIRTRHDDGEHLVTAIEVLSLANKTPGRGRDLYLRKQRELLDSPVHLVEVDLLRGGAPTTAVPRDRAEAAAGPFDYHIAIHRFDRLEDFEVYPIRLDEPLPTVAVPLLPGDPDVPVDLQALFARCYDAGPYRRRVRYDATMPTPPLAADREAWARAILATAVAREAPPEIP